MSQFASSDGKIARIIKEHQEGAISPAQRIIDAKTELDGIKTQYDAMMKEREGFEENITKIYASQKQDHLSEPALLDLHNLLKFAKIRIGKDQYGNLYSPIPVPIGGLSVDGSMVTAQTEKGGDIKLALDTLGVNYTEDENNKIHFDAIDLIIAVNPLIKAAVEKDPEKQKAAFAAHWEQRDREEEKKMAPKIAELEAQVAGGGMGASR